MATVVHGSTPRFVSQMYVPEGTYQGRAMMGRVGPSGTVTVTLRLTGDPAPLITWSTTSGVGPVLGSPTLVVSVAGYYDVYANGVDLAASAVVESVALDKVT